MTVFKEYNSSTSQWETILVGDQGADGADGVSTPATPEQDGLVKGLTGDLVNGRSWYGVPAPTTQFSIVETSTNVYTVTVHGGETFADLFGDFPATNPYSDDFFVAGMTVSFYITSTDYDYLFVETGNFVSLTPTQMVISAPQYYNVTSGLTFAFDVYLIHNQYSENGYANTFLGENAGLEVSDGNSQNYQKNVAIGHNAMSKEVTLDLNSTSKNIAIGPDAGNDFYGEANIFIGTNAGSSYNTTGGQRALYNNTFIGNNSGRELTSYTYGLTLLGDNNSGYTLANDPNFYGSEVVIGTGDTYAIRAKSYGNVQLPNQPYLEFHRSSNLSYNNSSQNVTIPFDSYVNIVGNMPYDISNGKILADLAGTYAVNCGVLANGAISQLWGIVNGVRKQSFVLDNTASANVAGSGLFYLNAGDTFGVGAWCNGATVTITANSMHTYLKIRYLG
jgi:hypothetical protein